MFRVICTTTSKFLYANGYIKKTSSNLQLKGSLLNLGFSITPPQSQNHFKTSFRCHISQCSLHLTNLKNMQRTELPTTNSKKIASKNPGTFFFPFNKKARTKTTPPSFCLNLPLCLPCVAFPPLSWLSTRRRSHRKGFRFPSQRCRPHIACGPCGLEARKVCTHSIHLVKL